MIKIEIIGREHLNVFLEGLQSFEKDKALRTGLIKGGQVLVRGGKRRLKSSLLNQKDGSGNLLKSFNVRVKRNKLGALIGFKRPIGNHSHLIDRGTKDRITKDGKYRGRVTPTAFWIDTKNSDMKEATSEVYNGIQTAVNKIKSRY